MLEEGRRDDREEPIIPEPGVDLPRRPDDDDDDRDGGGFGGGFGGLERGVRGPAANLRPRNARQRSRSRQNNAR